MAWWLPFAVVAAALLASLLAPAPRPRRRADDEIELDEGGGLAFEAAGEATVPPRRDRSARERFLEDDLDDESAPPRRAARGLSKELDDDLGDDAGGDLGETARPAAASSAAAPSAVPSADPSVAAPPVAARTVAARTAAAAAPTAAPAADSGPNVLPFAPPRDLARKPLAERGPGGETGRGAPITDRPGVDAPSYYRDPAALEDWPQADAAQEAVRAFLDRWGGTGNGVSTFRKVEVVPGSNERAFAFVVVMDPQKQGKETTLLARVCAPSENAEHLSRIWVTKYFDHIGERFRADVAKTPQHSRGVISVRDVPGGNGGRGAVALDYEAPLKGSDPYDDIRPEDVGQYKNLLNIMRMFS